MISKDHGGSIKNPPPAVCKSDQEYLLPVVAVLDQASPELLRRGSTGICVLIITLGADVVNGFLARATQGVI